jgi:uncharacterized lipoprotein NlpE involved in copper resistance
MEVVLDRMQRASNFASNGVYMVTEAGNNPAETTRTYINAARRMLDAAEVALDAVIAQ